MNGIQFGLENRLECDEFAIWLHSKVILTKPASSAALEDG
jgi:hypothetical protein